MNPNDPLAQLKGLHLPPEIGLWPPALGWWLSTILALSVLAYSLYRFIRWYHNTAYRRLALKELKTIKDTYLTNETVSVESAAFEKQLGQLLKRTALSAFPRSDTASLSGREWLLNLDKTGNTQEFSKGIGKRLMENRFSRRPSPLNNNDANELIKLCRQWIKQHR
ncbi:MAG: DUF4381 domain-containing protein [Gammaproteobacteria bacterium]|nr:DUF4381 domain-containing protein [Gammaproteobacteria bacterium]